MLYDALFFQSEWNEIYGDMHGNNMIRDKYVKIKEAIWNSSYLE